MIASATLTCSGCRSPMSPILAVAEQNWLSLGRESVVKSPSTLALKQPIEPMLAKLADGLPIGNYLYEPKWDGCLEVNSR